MHPTDLSSVSLADRLVRLEQQHRQLKQGLIALLIIFLLGVGYYSRATREVPVIKTRQIILLDGQNRESSSITFDSITLQHDKKFVALSPEKLRIFQDDATETELSPLRLSILGAAGTIELSPQGTKIMIKAKQTNKQD